MKSRIGYVLRKFALVFMTGLVLMFIVNKAVFMHTHRLSDGTIVHHAHPFNKATDKAPYKTHHHSHFELLLLQSITILFLNAITGYALSQIYTKISFSAGLQRHYDYLKKSFRCERSPPLIAFHSFLKQ